MKSSRNQTNTPTAHLPPPNRVKINELIMADVYSSMEAECSFFCRAVFLSLSGSVLKYLHRQHH